jgi:hypothetical protein
MSEIQLFDLAAGDWTPQKANTLTLAKFTKLISAICDFLEDKYYKQAIPIPRLTPVWERTINLHNHLIGTEGLVSAPALQQLGISAHSDTLDQIITKIHTTQNEIPRTPHPIDKVLQAPTYWWFWNSTERQFWSDLINLVIHATNARVMADQLLPDLMELINTY